MIKVKSFHDHLISDLDEEMEKYIQENHIIRQDIIDTKFYSAKGEDGYLYHYGKLVYETKETSQLFSCSDCGNTAQIDKPLNTPCLVCGSKTWDELK